jgi:hypothetical protein
MYCGNQVYEGSWGLGRWQHGKAKQILNFELITLVNHRWAGTTAEHG